MIQRRINRRILSNPRVISWPAHLYGSIPNQRDEGNEVVSRDYISCAKVHCGAKSMLKLDVKDFFDNVHRDLVFRVFRDLLKYPDPVSDVLADLCTFDSHLVQGALTSSYLASLCLHDVESYVVDRLAKKNLVYTRFVDDITVTSKVSNYDFAFARQIIEKMLLDKDLPLNNSKSKVVYGASEPLTVHGLRISFSEPRLPSDEVRRIRAAVKNIEVISAERSYRLTHAYRHDFNKCMGRVNKLARIGHNQHQMLVDRLLKVYPLPSKKDISRCIQIVSRLERDYPMKHGTYWYSRRFYLAHERLNVLKRLYPRMTKILRSRLRTLRPNYY
jgi:RNA-directed DNA polymerase